MSARNWLILWTVLTISTLTIIGSVVYKVDPFFHYHKPNTDTYYYRLDNERSQNDGIIKHFDYDALITGSSMTTNFMTTQLDELFGCRSIKIPYSGGTYKEVNDAVKKALSANPDLRLVVRSIDLEIVFSRWDAMREDMGEYPTYLYDNNPFNDVEYLLNRDVVWEWVYPMITNSHCSDFNSGITSFNDYTNWQDQFDYGINTVLPDGISEKLHYDHIQLTPEDKQLIKETIEKNVTNIADEHPQVDFYYFYPPYSIAFWYSIPDPELQLEAEAYVTELIVPHRNIHLFSFNNRTDITTDLNNYKDTRHYAEWINRLILEWMHEGKYRLTEENYRDYLKTEYDFYTTFDYTSLNDQIDYDDDDYASTLIKH